VKGEEIFLNLKTEWAILLLFLLWVSIAHTQNLLEIPLYIGNREIRVEVAKTPEEWARGLKGRKELGKDRGMLFIFETEDYHSFWMKDTLIPLSIAFIDKECRIIEITEMEPLTLESHTPSHPVLYALEMKRGWFASHGIQSGDIVKFSR